MLDGNYTDSRATIAQPVEASMLLRYVKSKRQLELVF